MIFKAYYVITYNITKFYEVYSLLSVSLNEIILSFDEFSGSFILSYQQNYCNCILIEQSPGLGCLNCGTVINDLKNDLNDVYI